MPPTSDLRAGLRPMPPHLASRYLAEGAWDDRSLGRFLSDALLQDTTRRIRIWSPTNPHLGTVGEVYEEALRVAGGLRARGLGPGDMVAFQLPNWVEAAVTFYACALLGVTLVPIVHFYGPKEVGFILRQSRARRPGDRGALRQARLPGRAGHRPRRPRRS